MQTAAFLLSSHDRKRERSGEGEGEGERGWMIADRKGKGVCMCSGIEDAEFKVKLLKMKAWEERGIVNMCERRREMDEKKKN